MLYLKRSTLILGALLILSASLMTTAVLRTVRRDSVPTAISSAAEHQTARDRALVYLFVDKLQEQSNHFYAPYYTVEPTIAYYFTSVKEVKEEDAHVCITFSTLPYIGPHDTIGEDEITFRVSYTGEITPTEFRHLKSDSLPDNLRSIEKGPLPPITE